MSAYHNVRWLVQNRTNQRTKAFITKKNQYIFHFRSWQYIQNKNVNGSTLNLNITNIYRNIHNSLFGIFAFQSYKVLNYNQDKNCSEFNNCKIIIWFEVIGKRYPKEFLDLDWDNEKYFLPMICWHTTRKCFFPMRYH